MKRIIALLFCIVFATQAHAYNVVKLNSAYIPNPSKGSPISLGTLYVGEPDTDPTVLANQVTLRVQEEDGDIVTVTQPLTLGAGGVPLYNGDPVTLLTDGNYSLAILNSVGSQVYYIPSDQAIDNSVNLSANDCDLQARVAEIEASATETALIVDCNPVIADGVTVTTNYTNLVWNESHPIVGTAGGGTETLTTNGGIKAGLHQIVDVTNLTWNGSPKISDAYAEWFGAVDGEATDSTVAVQAAINLNKNKPWILHFSGRYGISATIAAATGQYRWDMGNVENPSISTAKSGLIWIGGNNDTVLEMQQPIYSNCSIAIYNDPTAHTGVRSVLWHNPDNSGDASKSNQFNFMLVGTKYGLSIGDFTNDGWSSNADDSQFSITTYNVANPMLVDSAGQDNLIITRAYLASGPYEPVALVEQRDYMIKVLRGGNLLKIGFLFMRLDGIEDDASAVDVQQGSIDIGAGSVEGGGVSACQVFNFTQTAGRNANVIRDFSVSDDIVNTSGVQATFSGRNGTILDGVHWSNGNVEITRPVFATKNVFITGYGFINSASGPYDLTEIGTRTRATSGLPVDAATSIGNVAFNSVRSTCTYIGNQAVVGRDFTTQAFLDNTALDIAEIEMGPTDTNDGSHISVIVEYHLYEGVTSTSNIVASGTARYTAVRDSTTHINVGTPVVIQDDPALDGYTAVAVTATIAKNETTDTVTLRLNQDNNVNQALRGTVTIYVQGSTSGLNSASVSCEDINVSI